MNSKPPIVMIHGMYGTGAVWHRWRNTFENAGYVVHTPTLRLHDVDPAAPPPPGIGTLSVLDYVADLEQFIRSLDAKPILIGHSMGGLIAQLLAVRGHAQAAVLVVSAAPAGINSVRWKPLRTFFRILSRWGFWRKPHFPTRRAADYGMFNRLEKSIADVEYSRFVHESGRALFEIAYWWLDSKKATRLDFAAMPCDLLIFGGADDGTVDPGVCRAMARHYGARASYTELSGHSHWPLAEPGWELITQQIMGWLKERQLA